AIVVDDGVATGGTFLAALRALRAQEPGRLIAAAPVASPQAAAAIAREADDFVAVQVPADLRSVGAWYDSFPQLEDDEVLELLERAHAPRPAPAEAAASEPFEVAGTSGSVEHEVAVNLGEVVLGATLTVPERPLGVVLFAHGAGSSRFSPRNRAVAGALSQSGMATLLCDLLTVEEAEAEKDTHALRFDIRLLASRLHRVVEWLRRQPAFAEVPIGLFGASTGAAAALAVAAWSPRDVAAVVSRGGRPDLAGALLPAVRAPTLLIVGGADRHVLALNQTAATRLGGPASITVIPGAGHLFEEPGALAEVARLAKGWFLAHFDGDRPAVSP
ncbi:MAG TPA: dienelactone hydrolase family protein, partial [Gemmatimonadales bacterium]|nr:dienelactone hydrolase family protein [Gemmatimonadales bacterium]